MGYGWDGSRRQTYGRGCKKRKQVDLGRPFGRKLTNSCCFPGLSWSRWVCRLLSATLAGPPALLLMPREGHCELLSLGFKEAGVHPGNFRIHRQERSCLLPVWRPIVSWLVPSLDILSPFGDGPHGCLALSLLSAFSTLTAPSHLSFVFFLTCLAHLKPVSVKHFITGFLRFLGTVNTGSHHVLPAVSWGSRPVRAALPECTQLSCLQSNDRTLLFFQKLPEPAGPMEQFTNCSKGCMLSPKQQSPHHTGHLGETRDLRAVCL